MHHSGHKHHSGKTFKPVSHGKFKSSRIGMKQPRRAKKHYGRGGGVRA
jgi:hypothetical protein